MEVRAFYTYIFSKDYLEEVLMSLIDQKYVEGTRRARNGNCHYKLKPRVGDGKLVMWMAIYNGTPNIEDRICPNCFRTAFSQETEICPRCGSQM